MTEFNCTFKLAIN